MSEKIEILLVEDNPHDAEMTIRSLKKVNLANKVVHLKDGAEALDFIFAKGSFAGRQIENKPKVILLDIKMPGKTGIEGMLIIHDQFPKIKVIMQTVVDDEDKIFASICNGASGYLLKNTPPAALLHAIMEVFEGGAPMTPAIAMKVLEKFRKQSVPTLKEFNNLSNRENDILECLVEGMSYKMIAIARNISIDTVRFHIRNIYEKLHVNSKSEAVVRAMRDKIG